MYALLILCCQMHYLFHFMFILTSLCLVLYWFVTFEHMTLGQATLIFSADTWCVLCQHGNLGHGCLYPCTEAYTWVMPSLISINHTHVTSLCIITLDLMPTTFPELVKKCQIIPPVDTSDRNGIFSVVSLVSHTAAPQVSRKIWQYRLGNFSLANELLPNLDPPHIVVDGDPNSSWNNWGKVLLDIMLKGIPNASLPSRRNLPWLSNWIIELMKKKKCSVHKIQGVSFSYS